MTNRRKRHAIVYITLFAYVLGFHVFQCIEKLHHLLPCQNIQLSSEDESEDSCLRDLPFFVKSNFFHFAAKESTLFF